MTWPSVDIFIITPALAVKVIELELCFCLYVYFNMSTKSDAADR